MLRVEVPYPLLLQDFQTVHEPSVLLRSYLSYVRCIAWPSEPSVCQSLVKEKEPIALIEQSLDAVCTPAAEDEEIAFLERIHLELLLYLTGKAIDAHPEIGIAHRQIDVSESCCVI